MGTRILPTSMPLGRRRILMISPTGSGRAATSRRPSAMALIRSAFSVNRSIMALDRPFFSASTRSFMFSAMSLADSFSSPAAILNRALFLISVEMFASARDAALAFFALSVTYCLMSIFISRFPFYNFQFSIFNLQYDKVVSMDHLIVVLVSQDAFDLRGLEALDSVQVIR